MPDALAGSNCPYCGSAGCNDVQPAIPHPSRTVMRCVQCDLYSTLQNGKRYPHDVPSDVDSSIALRIKL